MPGSTVAGSPSLSVSLCRLNCCAAPPSAPSSSLSESPWAPAIVFGIADMRCGIGVGVRVLLPPVVSLRDICPPSSRCQRIACRPSCSAISEGALSALSPCDGATLFNSSSVFHTELHSREKKNNYLTTKLLLSSPTNHCGDTSNGPRPDCCPHLWGMSRPSAVFLLPAGYLDRLLEKPRGRQGHTARSRTWKSHEGA